MHLVVDDQPPVAGVEQLQVADRRPSERMVVSTWYVAIVTGRISLTDAGVLADLVSGQ